MAAAADSTDKAQMAKANDATDSARIGWAFLSQYYSYLNKDPARLHCFYTKRSTLIHSTEGEDTVACYGQSEIHDKIMSLGFDDCKVYISNVDSQSSAEGGIIVQVIGEMSNSNGPWKKFAQTFFLAEQPNGYFVLNDICRYIKEEGDEDSTTPVAPPTTSSTQASEQQDRPTSTSTPATTDAAPASVESVLFNDVKPAQEEVKKEEEEVRSASKLETVEPSPAAQQPNGDLTNGDVVEKSQSKEEEPAVVVEPLSAVEHKSNETAAPVEEKKEEEKTETPAPVPAIEEVKKVEKEEAAPAPTPVVPEEEPTSTPEVSQSSTSSAPQPASASASAPVASTPAPTPAPAPASTPAPAPAPAAPKSWASLAASKPWGSLNKPAAPQKSAEPAPAPASSSAQTPSSAASSSTTPAVPSQFTEQVQAVQHSNCFVKGVLEYVTEKQLREVLTTRFGPLKELDIIRSKACAFVEFSSLNDARKAIQVSMRHQDGGENGIIFETPSGDKARINVVERKPHNERPPPKPRSGTNDGNAAGGNQGGKGGQQKDGQQGQRSNQGGRTGGGRNNPGGRGSGGQRTGGGGRQQQQQGGQQK